jgi:REP element-mobilizing transposase RayT
LNFAINSCIIKPAYAKPAEQFRRQRKSPFLDRCGLPEIETFKQDGLNELIQMHEAEWQTRKQRIETKLRALSPSWEIIPWRDGLDLSKLSRHVVTEIPTDNGPADYGFFVNGRFLGILEAKKVTVNPQNVLEQAKRYARGAVNGSGNWNGFHVPFLYASNGEIIWHLDARQEKPVSRRLLDFHTAPAMEERFAFDDKPARKWLLDTPAEKIIRLRPYQVAAIVAAESSILAGQRELLIAMATGTGKTFLTVAQVYRLLESKQFRRILFLVDRKALAAQAVRTFNAFDTPQGNKFTQEYEVYSQKFQKEDFGDDEPFDPKVLPNEYLTNPNSTHTFVYVSTIQRMARNLFGAEASFAQSASDPDTEDDADKLDIPIHAFDLIIADECHRGYLPHVKREGASYFITFRLADSLPQEVLQEFKRQHAEKLRALQDAKPAARELIDLELQRQIERYLDRGAGECHLKGPGVAQMVIGALLHFHQTQYLLDEWVVMPNHVHLILWPMPNHTLSDILRSRKRHTARQANLLLGRMGRTFWQHESYDHWIRNDEEKARIRRYIRHNPVKAGLCQSPEEWRWSSAYQSALQTRGCQP